MVRQSKRNQRDRAAARREPQALDLAQFASLEDAIRETEPGDRYLEIGKLLLPLGKGMPVTMPHLFFLSMITRSEGLHGAVSREIKNKNPHAVFPLIRAFAEAVVLVIYVNDHPTYIDVLTARPSERPKGAPRRKSMQALISHASRHAPGMKEVYSELSEGVSLRGSRDVGGSFDRG